MANTKVQSEQIEDGSITADKIADGAIVATELADNAVTTAKINADAVTGAKIADDAIDSEHYTDGSIDTAHIADAQITVAKMAANSVDSDQYVDGSIDTVHIGDAQVTTAKITDGNISTAKIADNAVTSAKIDTNIDIAGTFDVTGATTLDSTATVAGNLVVGGTNVDAAGTISLQSDGDIRGVLASGAGGDTIISAISGVSNGYQITVDSSNNQTYKWHNAGNVSMTIDSSGRVGVGSGISYAHGDADNFVVYQSDNNVGLTIASAADHAGNIFFSDATSGGGQYAGYILYNHSDNRMSFGTSESEALRIDTNGNVGIEYTTPSSMNSSGYNLVVGNGVSGVNKGITIFSNSDSSGSLHFADGTTGADAYRGIITYAHASNYMRIFTDATERMRIDSSGRVGINRTPAIANAKLEVGGADNVPLINVEASGNTAGIGIGSSEMKFFHGTTKRMGITTAGGLNVGNTTGASGGGIQTYVGDNDEAIDCEGSGRVNFTINSDETGGNRWYFRTAGSGNFGSANGDLVVLKEDGTEIMRWDLSAMTINGDFNDTSDVALKENIADITDATTKIKALQPRTFDWKDKTKAQGTNGFIAQEVETVLPKLIIGDDYDAENPHHGNKSINTSGLLAVAVKAIQEQQEQIEQLKSEIEALKS